MNTKNINKSLFTDKNEEAIYAGYPNIADVLRASDEGVLRAVSVYSQRCGHVPLDDLDAAYILVGRHTDKITSQHQYLSKIYKKTLIPKTARELNDISKKQNKKVVVVPYINVQETQTFLSDELNNFDTWGLPSSMTHKLKNKAESHKRIEKAGIKNLNVPDFEIVDIEELVSSAERFISDKVINLYHNFNQDNYIPGVMVRFVECDGNYGAGVVKAYKNKIVFHPDGNKFSEKAYDSWKDALAACYSHIKSTMNPAKETRVIISRLIELLDSPGMSVALINGEICSLGLNSQLQSTGTACIGTATYVPKNNDLEVKKKIYEQETVNAFKTLIKKLAKEEAIDLDNLNAFINIDLIIPAKNETDLQKKRFGKIFNYISESNPRFTNWTDAVLTGVAAQGERQTISSMLKIINNGIQAIDKVKLPENVTPEDVRDEIYKKDLQLQQFGTRIIARMTESPMGVIYMGDISKAQKELDKILKKIT